MRMIPRLTAALVAGSFALTTLPVSAMGMGVDLSHSSYVGSSLDNRTGNHVSESAEASLKANRKTQGSADASTSVTATGPFVAKNEDKIKADMGLHLGWYKKSHTGSTSTDAEVKAKLERKQTMFESMLKRSFNAIAQMSLRICKLAGGDGTTMRQCLNNRRDAFKLRIAAMIDTAFNITL